MKKNITINLFGTLYNIDEDAYELLRQYQNNMRSFFSRKEGGEEIADDVEHRVAELFDELRTQGVAAITIEHVQDIIRRIGDPQQMEESDAAETTAEATPPPYEGSHSYRSRRLFRDPEDRILGGVLSGICRYFGIDDPVWVRLAFILITVLSVSTFGLLYLVGWAIIPEARTAEERLQMRGEPINPQAINEEMMRTVNRAQNFINDPHTQDRARGCFGTLVRIIAVCGIVFAILSLMGLLVPLLVFIVGMGFSLIADSATFLPFWLDNPDICTALAESNSFQWSLWPACIGWLIVLIIPLFLLIRRLTRKPDAPSMRTSSAIGFLILWLIALTVAIVSTVFAGNLFAALDDKIENQRHSAYVAANTHDGIYLTKESWDFLRDNEWTPVQMTNVSPYVREWDKHYRHGEEEGGYVLRLTRESDTPPFQFQVEKKGEFRPGRYQFLVTYRTDAPTGMALYVQVGTAQPVALLPLPATLSDPDDDTDDIDDDKKGRTRYTTRSAEFSLTSTDSLSTVRYGITNLPLITGQQASGSFLHLADVQVVPL